MEQNDNSVPETRGNGRDEKYKRKNAAALVDGCTLVRGCNGSCNLCIWADSERTRHAGSCSDRVDSACDGSRSCNRNEVEFERGVFYSPAEDKTDLWCLVYLGRCVSFDDEREHDYYVSVPAANGKYRDSIE